MDGRTPRRVVAFKIVEFGLAHDLALLEPAE